jgi:hypothetical protein
MAAGKYSFNIEQGSTVKFDVAYKDSNDAPIDLTNYQGRMSFKDTAGGSTTYLTLSSSLGPCGSGLNFSGSTGLLPPTSGTIGVIISSATSSLLTFNEASYDLEIASGSGDCAVVTRLIEGRIKLVKEVTTGSYN